MQPRIEPNMEPMMTEHLHSPHDGCGGHGDHGDHGHHHHAGHASQGQAGEVVPEDGAALAAEFLPTPQDPRILLTLPVARREAVQILWTLALRLTKLLDDVREPMIGQIKLAWWRDMMAMLGSDPDGLPKGEPLLADFQAHFHGVAGIESLVDAAEAMLLAEDHTEQTAAAQQFGQTLFALSMRCAAGTGGDTCTAHGQAGQAWGLLWGAYVQRGHDSGAAMLTAAGGAAKLRGADYGAGRRGWMMLDRLAVQIGQFGGARDLRREGLLMLRLGLFGR